jgi:hypothetical protein
MPEGYGAPEKGNVPGQGGWDEVRRKLTDARNYWIVSASSKGRAHAMPVWGVWMDDALWFGTDPASRKGRNLAANPELIVHLESGDDVVIVEGRAERLTDRESKVRLSPVYQAKYDVPIEPDNPDHGLYVVRPRVVLTWQEADFVNSRTRWVFGR